MRRKFLIISGIIIFIFCIPAISLFVLSKIHYQAAHDEFVEFINQELDGEITFEDFSFSYLSKFPSVHIELDGVSVHDGNVEVLHIAKLDILLNLRKLWNKKLKIKKLLAEGLVLYSQIDSLGNKSRLFTRKNEAPGSPHEAWVVESHDIHIKNGKIYFGNKIKGNRMYLQVDKADLNLSENDSLLIFTGTITGTLDSLISNNTVLFTGQPITAKDLVFTINHLNGFKELEQGYILAHSLKITPRFTMKTHEDGQIIEIHISGENNLNTFLNLFEFHTGLDLKQVNPDAQLQLSYNQLGFVNPFLRPYSELDFQIIDAEFTGKALPFPLKLGLIKGNYNNGEGHSPETAELVIDTLHARVQESFVNARFKLSNLKDPVIDAHFIARLDMGHLIKENENYSLAGEIDLDLEINGKISELKKLHLEGKQQASGTIDVKDLELVLKDNGYTIEIIKGSALLNNQILEVAPLLGEFNESVFHFQGFLDNLDQYILKKNENLAGQFTLNFEEIDLRKINFDNKQDEGPANFSLSPFASVNIEFGVNGKRLITQIGIVENIKLNGSLEDLDVNVDLTATEIVYHDVKISNFRSHIHATEQEIEIDDLFTDLPFGNIKMDLLISDYQNDQINYSGTIDLLIDSLDVDNYLALEAFGIPDLRKKEEQETSEQDQVNWPDNLKLKVITKAGYLSYENAAVEKLRLFCDYDSEQIRLEELNFIFAGGSVKVHGYMDHDQPNSFPGYLYSKVDRIDIQEFFTSFDNFNQDIFTAENSSGKISWTSDYYFGLNENFKLLKDENLWSVNLIVHDAEFDKVAPIEKTLFFVGHKAKDNMIVSELDIDVFMFQNKMYFKDVLMNDNIANMEVFGEVDLDKKELDLGLEISLTDLFLRSKKKRRLETQEGVITLDKDKKLLLRMSGPISDHKLKMMSKRKFRNYREDLIDNIEGAEIEFKRKHKGM
ncbi:MAG: AsmA family protein [Bacteroidales bacterium]|nr:AsmA family protein [Bacteroidales bacterium]